MLYCRAIVIYYVRYVFCVLCQSIVEGSKPHTPQKKIPVNNQSLMLEGKMYRVKELRGHQRDLHIISFPLPITILSTPPSTGKKLTIRILKRQKKKKKITSDGPFVSYSHWPGRLIHVLYSARGQVSVVISYDIYVILCCYDNLAVRAYSVHKIFTAGRLDPDMYVCTCLCIYYFLHTLYVRIHTYV